MNCEVDEAYVGVSEVLVQNLLRPTLPSSCFLWIIQAARSIICSIVCSPNSKYSLVDHWEVLEVDVLVVEELVGSELENKRVEWP